MIEFEPEGFDDLGNRLDRAGTATKIAINDGLRQLGGQGVPILKAHTPVGATSHLRNKTVFQIRTLGDEQVLQIRQGARSGGFFYGKTVRGGRRPGRRPPSSALIPWVQKKLGVSGTRARSVAFLVARKIGRVGTKPNPYHLRAFQQMRPLIQQTASRMGQRIVAFLAGG